MAGGTGDIDGIGESARFGRWSESLFSSGPIGLGSVVLDTYGNAFVTDGYNGIRKISPGREVITVAEVSGHGLATDSEGNLYVAEDTAIVKIAPSGELSTIAGAVREEGYVDGPGTVARFGRRTEMSVDGISGMTRDSAGNLYVLDPGNNAIREVSRFDDAWRVSTLGGFQDTNGNSVTLISRGAIAVDHSGTLYLMQGTALQKLTPAGTNWIVTTLAGSPTESGSKDGPGREARFAYDSQHGGYPMGIAVDKQHNVFVSDTVNNMIRKVSRNGMVTTLGGNFAVGSQDGIGALARFYSPHGIAASDDGTLYIADYGNLTFRKGFPAPVMESSGTGFGYTDGVFRSGITVPAGQLTVLEASTNLAQWTRLDTNVVGGSVPVSDSEAKSFSRRFYRTHLP
jgi:sugar lactone lactonase YvrE